MLLGANIVIYLQLININTVYRLVFDSALQWMLLDYTDCSICVVHQLVALSSVTYTLYLSATHEPFNICIDINIVFTPIVLL